MRKEVIIVGILCSFILLLALASASLSCSLTTRAGCANTPVLYIQNDSGGYENAHVQNVSVNSYAYALCCSSTYATLSSACQSTPLFKLANLTNAHLQFGNYSGPGSVYGTSVCLSSSRGNMTCAYSPGACPAGYQVTMGSLASSNLTAGNLTDAHFGSSTKYQMKQCCYIAGLYPGLGFQGATPADGFSQTATSAVVNLSTNDSYGKHYAFLDFDSSFVAGWRMDEVNASGGIADIKGVYNASNISGAFHNTTEGSGAFGKAYAFDGTNDYLQASKSLTQLDMTNKTISAWVRIRSNKQQAIVDKAFDNPGSYGGWSFWIQATGKLWWWAHANKDLYDTGTAVPLNNWTHVAIVWNAHTKNVTFYLNGAFNSQKQDGTIIEQASTTSFLNIGAMRNGSNFYLNGQVDEVLLFNRTFSASEISALYNASATNYYNNFTYLATGTHTYKGYAVDWTGNSNSTELRTLTITSGDAIGPAVTSVNEYPSDPATYAPGQNYSFNVTITDDTGIARVLLTFNGTNYTASNSSSVFNVTVSNLGVGTYAYTWFANDTLGNVNRTVSGTYTIAQATQSLNLTLNGTAGNYSMTVGGTIALTTTILTGLGNVSLYVDGAVQGSAVSTLSNLTTFGTAGLYNITAYSTGNANYSGGTQTYWLNVTPDVTAPVVTVLSPTATTYRALPLVFNVSLNENGSVQYSLDNGVTNYSLSGNSSGTGFTGMNTSIADGSYTFRVYANDTTGNVNTTVSVGFTFQSYQQSNISLQQGWNMLSITVPGQNDSGTDRNISITAGYNLIGSSGATDFAQSSLTYTVSGGSIQNLSDAATSGYVQSSFSFYNVSSFAGFKFTPKHDAYVRAKKGYWVYANNSGVITLPGVGGTYANATFPIANLTFTNASGSSLNASQAFLAGWIGTSDGYDYVFQMYNASTGFVQETGSLSAWRGYFVRANQPSLTMVVQQ